MSVWFTGLTEYLLSEHTTLRAVCRAYPSRGDCLYIQVICCNCSYFCLDDGDTADKNNKRRFLQRAANGNYPKSVRSLVDGIGNKIDFRRTSFALRFSSAPIKKKVFLVGVAALLLSLLV